MSRLFQYTLLLAFLVCTANFTQAQPPREGGQGRGPGGPGGAGGPGGPGGPGGGRGGDPQEMLSRIMELDKNQDGKLTEDEYKDSRWTRILEASDSNKDKTISRDELNAQLTKQTGSGGPGFAGGPGGPGGQGMQRGRGMGPMFRPGTVLPAPLIEQLGASEEQRQALAKLQATVDAELAKILSADQLEQLKQFAQVPRGEGGPREGGPREGGPREGRQEPGREPRRPESESPNRPERP